MDVVEQYLALIDGDEEEKKKIVRRYATVIIEDLKEQIYSAKEEKTDFTFQVQTDLIMFTGFVKNTKKDGRLGFKKEVPDKKNIRKYSKKFTYPSRKRNKIMIKNAFIESLKIVDGRFIHPELHWQRITDTQRVHFGNSTFLPLSSESIPPDKRLGTLKCRIIYDQEIRKIDFETYSPRRVHTLKLVDGSDID